MTFAVLALSFVVPFLPAVSDDTTVARADALVRAGDTAAASALLEEAVAAGGDDAIEAGVMLSGLQLAAGDPQAALATLEALDAKDDARACGARGRAFMACADQIYMADGATDDMQIMLADGRAQFERAVELAPADLGPQVELAYVQLYRFGESAAVVDFATSALADHPDDGELLLLRGCAGAYVYWNAKQSGDAAAADAAWNTSVADLKQAANRLPRERIEPWGQLVWFYEDKGQPEQAVEAAIAIVDRQSEPDLSMLYRLAVRYTTQDRNLAAAGLALEKMVSLSARDLTTRLRAEADLVATANALGAAIDPFVQRQDNGAARAILQAIVAAEPAAPDVWHNYAVMCENTSRFEDACVAYEKLIEIDPKNPRAYNDLGAVLQHQLKRDLDRAKELYQTCIDLASEQLLAQDLTEARRAELVTARNTAQVNLDELAPASSAGGLLEGLLEGLSGLELPELPEDEPAEGTTDGSASGESGTEPAAGGGSSGSGEGG